MKKEITKEKLNNYFSVTQRALDKLKIITPEKTHLNNASKDLIDLAKRYFDDATYFKKNDDFVNAFACLNYAHGLLDCLARVGFIDVSYDNKLFIVDDLK